MEKTRCACCGAEAYEDQLLYGDDGRMICDSCESEIEVVRASESARKAELYGGFCSMGVGVIIIVAAFALVLSDSLEGRGVGKLGALGGFFLAGGASAVWHAKKRKREK